MRRIRWPRSRPAPHRGRPGRDEPDLRAALEPDRYPDLEARGEVLGEPRLLVCREDYPRERARAITEALAGWEERIAAWRPLLELPVTATFGLLAVFVCHAIAADLGQRLGHDPQAPGAGLKLVRQLVLLQKKQVNKRLSKLPLNKQRNNKRASCFHVLAVLPLLSFPQKGLIRNEKTFPDKHGPSDLRN